MGYFATRLTKYFNTVDDMLAGGGLVKLCEKFISLNDAFGPRQAAEIVFARGGLDHIYDSISRLLSANGQAIRDPSFRYVRWHLDSENGGVLIVKFLIRLDGIPNVCIQFEPLGSSDVEHAEKVFSTICRELAQVDDRCLLESKNGYFASPLALYVYRKSYPFFSVEPDERLLEIHERFYKYGEAKLLERLTMTPQELDEWMGQFEL